MQQLWNGWQVGCLQALRAETVVIYTHCQGVIFHFSNFDFWQVKIPTCTHYRVEISSLPLPPCTSTPLQLTHQDEHGQEQNKNSTQLRLSQSCPKTTTTTSVTDISTLGISNRGDLWRLPPHLQEPFQAGALSGRNPPDNKSHWGQYLVAWAGTL